MTLDRPSLVNLVQVQHTRKAALLAAIAGSLVLLVFGEPQWPGGGILHESIEGMGIGLILFCIIGRTWCSIYIAGRKIRQLVAVGPYSVSRNPLYVFSIIGAVGAGAQLGSFVIALTAGVIAWAVFFVVVRKEEKAMEQRFGDTYRSYLASVPRFLPKWSLWRDAEKVEVRPQLIVRTFLDACVFLLAIPIAEGFEYLHKTDLLPAILSLP